MQLPLALYAQTIAAYLPNCDVTLTLRGLKLCEALGQIWPHPGGFVSWLRSEWASLDYFKTRDFNGITTLSMRELTAGPVLYVAEIVALRPGLVLGLTRKLAALPGVEALAAHRSQGTRWKVQRVRHEPRRQ